MNKALENLISSIKSKSKEINADFSEALDAILFFEQDKLNEEIYKELSTALIGKLSENFKRIYANKRREKKNAGSLFGAFSNSNQDLPDNILSLEVQQQNIYDALILLSKYTKLDDQNIKNIGFSKTEKDINNYSIFYYLTFHDSLKHRHLESHLKLLESAFANQDLSQSIVNDLLSINYKKERANATKHLLKKFPINKIKSINNIAHKNGRFLSDLFCYCAKHQIDLDEDLKNDMFKHVFSRSSYLAKSDIDVNVFIDLIKSYISEDVIKEQVESKPRINYPLMKNKVEYAVFMLSDSIKLYSSLSLTKLLNDNKNIKTKNFILSKIDIRDTFDMIDLNSNSNNSKLELMEKFVNNIEKRINKDDLSYLLSLNSDYIGVVKPFYMKTRLELEFAKQDEERGITPNKVPTNKI